MFPDKWGTFSPMDMLWLHVIYMAKCQLAKHSASSVVQRKEKWISSKELWLLAHDLCIWKCCLS